MLGRAAPHFAQVTILHSLRRSGRRTASRVAGRTASSSGLCAGTNGSATNCSAANCPQTSGKAIASLICGLVMIFPFFILAVIFGHLALSDIRRSAGRLKGHGMAIAGLVLGYSAIPLVLIFAAIAIPNLLRARIFANEASAVGNVRNIVSAEISYQTAHPQAGFTCNLSDLSGLPDSDLVSGQKHGYVFALQNCTAEKEGGPASHFHITASPVTYNTTGVRAFCADESEVTRSDNTGSAQGCLEQGSPLE